MGDKADVWQGTLTLMILKTLETLGPRFAPHPAAIPDITVKVAPLHLYDELSTVQLVGVA